MPLTSRTNGSGSNNIITASWFNDFYKLFTGAMSDQPITFQCNEQLQAIGAAPSSAGTASAVSGSGLSAGPYTYVYTYVSADGGETLASPQFTVTTTSGNQKVALSNISVGPTGTTKRNIYRTSVNGVTLKLCLTINDNTSTTVNDTTPDSSLQNNIQPPWQSTFGAYLTFLDATGTQNCSISQAGNIITNGDIYMEQGTLRLYTGSSSQGSTIGTIEVPRFGGFGVRRWDGVKLCEAKTDGKFIIGGSQYQTTGTYATAGNQSFDSFDVGEVFKCEKELPNGTVVCPDTDEQMHQCTHENCHAASVISYNPGMGMGTPEHENGVHYIALCGRVLVRTANDIPVRSLVVSDGRGGVRPVRSGEPSFVMGVVISPARLDETDKLWKVGVLLRPMFCVLK